MRLFIVNLLLTFFLLVTPALSQVITGKVIHIADGDTITILDSSRNQHKIRLYGIDTPEKGQAFGQAAKKFTSSLTASKTAEVTVYDTDKYGRTVGVVMVNGTNVNQSLIKAGYAWQYRKYCKEAFCNDWLRLEDNARNLRLGLWADKHPETPWDYRKGIRNGTTSSKTERTYTASAGSYHGNVKSHVFHAPSCRGYNCKNCVKSFGSRQAALNSGYRPCGICKP
ncbi:thermonuclease family protein [Desulfopila sp. IMCC35006]|uniref:thermonuclease family protein n=1 Tax=Desulfopila sp. IMCC35006 TaxID=2569542 RepID=UPI001F10E6FA|nr:thermonuclease family protein [Desulfopila sp. IMCC35006]